MPKTKKSKKRTAPIEPQSTSRVKPWVRWMAMAIVFALGVSLLAGALTAQAASASEPVKNLSSLSTNVAADRLNENDSTCLLDNDSDGVANPDDPDVDGDGIVNGEDSDIDGDGLDNSQDGDPVATNCDDAGTPPLLGTTYTAGEEAFDWPTVITYSLLGAAVLGIAAALVLRRKKVAPKIDSNQDPK